MKNTSFYSASDKVIFDALNQHKITKQNLRDLFFKRGTLISKQTEKEVLAKNFSAFLHDYTDYSLLSTILGVATRKEKTTSFDLITNTNLDDFESVARELSSNLSKLGDNVDVNVVNNKIMLSISYKTCDFSKSELRQIVDKSLSITIEKNTSQNGYTIRGNLNDKFNEISDSIINKISKLDPDSSKDEINLSSIKDPKIRNIFFNRLTQEIPDHKHYDVTDVFVINPDQENSEEVVHITKASLKGKGVTLSKELNDLHEKNFYIWKIVWCTVIDKDMDSDIYEFEALFEDPIDCRKFSYITKGCYKLKEKDDNTASIHTKNRISLPVSQEDNLNKKIEYTAKTIVSDLLSSLSS